MFEVKMDRIELRRLVIEALEEMKTCSECGGMYEVGAVHECGMYESDNDKELDEFSGAGAVAGYTMPLGMRPPGPRSSITNVAHRSFGGLGGSHKKRKKR
jgi:hypothetical protein